LIGGFSSLEGRVRLSIAAILFSFLISPISSAQTQKPAHVSATPEKVIIDTDIGDDIDDAFAVALALKSPELEILGISTTFGDTEARAKIVDRPLVEPPEMLQWGSGCQPRPRRTLPAVAPVSLP
jgi:hypothetical protein